MSEDNSEKTPGQIATDLINLKAVSPHLTKAHKQFDKDPTMTAEEFRQLPQTFGLKSVKKDTK